MTTKTLAERLRATREAFDHYDDIADEPVRDEVRDYISALSDALDAKDAEIARLKAIIRGEPTDDDHSGDPAFD